MAAGVSGRSVLVTGVGTIGLMAVTIARAAGAGRFSSPMSAPVGSNSPKRSAPMLRSTPATTTGRERPAS